MLADLPQRIATDLGGGLYQPQPWSEVLPAIHGSCSSSWIDELNETLAAESCLGHAQTSSRCDVGLWFRRRLIHLLVTDRGIHLLAHGHSVPPRPLHHFIALSNIKAHCYNHITGSFIMEQLGMGRSVTLSLSPLDGHHLAGLITSLRSSITDSQGSV